MRFIHRAASLAALLSVPAVSVAAPKAQLYPVQLGSETIHFRQGMPTLDLEEPEGAVEVTPLPLDHGRLTFGLAVYNKTYQSANFGIENVSASVGAETVSVLSKDQLVAKAKNRAMWQSLAVAALAGAAAGVASTAHNTYAYRSAPYSPRGVRYQTFVWRDNTPGIVGAAAATGVGAAGIVGIRNRLDYTINNLSEDIVQTTTIDPDASYGGRIVLDKPKHGTDTYDVRITVRWNGADYPFAFRMTEPGKNAPPPFTVTAISAPPVLSQVATDYSAPVGAGQPGLAAVAAPPALSPIATDYSAPVGAAQPGLAAAPPRRVLTPYQLGQLQGQAALRAAGGSQ